MSEAIWHDVECGGYRADLVLWRRLAGEAPAHVLDVGCGAGRVAIDLAKHGHVVTGLDISTELLAELGRRSVEAGVEVKRVEADARDFSIPKRFDLVLAPMQLIQILSGAEQRLDFLRSARAAVEADGLVCVALMDLSGEPTDDAYISPLPDVREVDGSVYSSLPTAIRTLDRGRAIALERERTRVSPDGEIERSKDTIKLRLLGPRTLEAEAAEAGLEPAGRELIGPTPDHVGSVVALLRPVS